MAKILGCSLAPRSLAVSMWTAPWSHFAVSVSSVSEMVEWSGTSASSQIEGYLAAPGRGG
jgi:hypothetical protein